MRVVPELVLEKSPFREEVKVLKNTFKLESYIVGLVLHTEKNLQRASVAALWKLARSKSS